MNDDSQDITTADDDEFFAAYAQLQQDVAAHPWDIELAKKYARANEEFMDRARNSWEHSTV